MTVDTTTADEFQAKALTATGLLGATAQGRFLGLAAAAPMSGAHLQGDFYITPAGAFIACTTTGTPGVFVTSTAYVDAAIAALVGTAPGILDTLGEIDTQLAADESVAAALATTVAGKVDKTTLTTDGDLLTRASGLVARVTRDALAADPAFTAAFDAAGAAGAETTRAMAAEALLIASSVLTANGDLLTRVAGVPSRVTRASLAADAAFTAAFDASGAAATEQARALAAEALLVSASVLTTNGDILTRAAGAPARITRASLAADAAFTGAFDALGAASTEQTRALAAEALLGGGIKAPCRLATAIGISLPNSPTYNAGTLTYTAGANAALVVDGTNAAVGDRILVKHQGVNGSIRNGIYVVVTAGSGSVPWVITRSTDADSSADLVAGFRVRVNEGVTNADTEWALSNFGAITLDTTVLIFEQLAVPAAFAPVRLATVTVLPFSALYSNASIVSISNGTLTVDGVTPAVGDRILVQNQVDTTQHGIYYVISAGSAGSTYTLRRALDAIVGGQFVTGKKVKVTEGTINAQAEFVLTTTGTIVLDTTLLTFARSEVGAQAWTSYTPVWTASVTNPVIGNGTIKGAYLLEGKTLRFRVSIVMGSTTTFGSSDWKVSLPSGVTPKTLSATKQIFSCYCYDTSAGAHYPGIGRADQSVTTFQGFTAGSGGVSALISSSFPFTWASGDEWHFSGAIEVD